MHDANESATVVLSRIADQIQRKSFGGSDNISQPND